MNRDDRLLHFFPRRWRDRYGDEFLAMLELMDDEEPLRRRSCINIIGAGLLTRVGWNPRRAMSGRATSSPFRFAAVAVVIFGGGIALGGLTFGQSSKLSDAFSASPAARALAAAKAARLAKTPGFHVTKDRALTAARADAARAHAETAARAAGDAAGEAAAKTRTKEFGGAVVLLPAPVAETSHSAAQRAARTVSTPSVPVTLHLRAAASPAPAATHDASTRRSTRPAR